MLRFKPSCCRGAFLHLAFCDLCSTMLSIPPPKMEICRHPALHGSDSHSLRPDAETVLVSKSRALHSCSKKTVEETTCLSAVFPAREPEEKPHFPLSASTRNLIEENICVKRGHLPFRAEGALLAHGELSVLPSEVPPFPTTLESVLTNLTLSPPNKINPQKCANAIRVKLEREPFSLLYRTYSIRTQWTTSPSAEVPRSQWRCIQSAFRTKHLFQKQPKMRISKTDWN
jgi:hypothetical protein